MTRAFTASWTRDDHCIYRALNVLEMTAKRTSGTTGTHPELPGEICGTGLAHWR